MPEKYVPLRVPIALLQQKVFSTSHRLPKWTGIVLDKKGTVVVPKVDAARVIGRVVSTGPVFESLPFLRRYFTKVDSGNKLECRWCGEYATTSMERAEHAECYKIMNDVLAEMVKDLSCAICDTTLDLADVKDKFHNVPVCSESCMSAWEWYSPELLRFQMELAREDMAAKSAAKSVNAILTRFGRGRTV